ncbi:hypothetical protein BXP70_28145 [Hymenobacter crusticola]|uniref:BT4734-like N-terminal domain-containing protein n=1 Tax=Hymenobacter crusticola TaxID=1770526 RepID=A0A243W5B2_9BACT|nr:hypothetical protein BXP70_28145 [Hymenobacter crusticola]
MVEPPKFSYYLGPIGNVVPRAAVTPALVYQVITGKRLRAKTEAIRLAEVGSNNRHELKKKLDYITPAGVFTKRDNKCLTERSGLMVLDFDHVPDLATAQQTLLTDAALSPSVVMMFVSPSGEGLKCLLAIDPRRDHLTNFKVLSTYLTHHYAQLGLVPDKSGKDPARACYLCHDPSAYLNPAYAA